MGCALATRQVFTSQKYWYIPMTYMNSAYQRSHLPKKGFITTHRTPFRLSVSPGPTIIGGLLFVQNTHTCICMHEHTSIYTYIWIELD